MQNTLTTTLQSLFTRDLNKLKKEIELYENEENMWIIENQISNSGGNLCLHLIGNLNAFICAVIGKTGYIRNREFEFSGKNVPRVDLINDIDKTIEEVNASLDLLTSEQLSSEYPIQVFKDKMTTEYFLIHLAGHLNYHLGQINYHRRLLYKNNTKH